MSIDLLKNKSKELDIIRDIPNYDMPPIGLGFTACSFAMGFGIGFMVFFIFYKILLVSILGGVMAGIVTIFSRRKNAVKKRRLVLRRQFLDMLEAVSVALRAGDPVSKALISARKDLVLTYKEDSDIVVELDMIIRKFNSLIPLSEAFMDFAERCKLEDVYSFASIYATIEGKSSQADTIVRETQRIISDKMIIEMEIETMMTSAKTEVGVMLAMPLVILLVIGYAGEGFMDAIYTTPVGRIVATGGLCVFFISYFMARKFSSIEL